MRLSRGLTEGRTLLRDRSWHAAPWLLAGIACLAGSSMRAQTVSLPPTRTYLHTNSDNAAATVPILLSALSLHGGDIVRLERVGDFRPGPSFQDTSVRLIAVFSGSGTLLASTTLHRVPDAVDAGDDFASANTYFGSQPTDIPEDFMFDASVVVTIPPGATHLFVAPHDSLYYDNSDPDQDFAVRITKLLAPSALRIWGGLVAAVQTDMAQLDVVTQGAPPARINLLDAVRLARQAAGID
jgi:hypothetical protein